MLWYCKTKFCDKGCICVIFGYNENVIKIHKSTDRSVTGEAMKQFALKNFWNGRILPTESR